MRHIPRFLAFLLWISPAMAATTVTSPVLLSPGATTSSISVPPYGVFDVRDFGATGNGTTDDTASVQAAETAAEAITNKSGEVLFPCGQYKIASGPVIIAAGTAITWKSECRGLSFNESSPYAGAAIINADTGDAVYANASSNFTQTGPTFVGLSFIGNSRTQNCLHINNFNGGLIDGDAFRDCGVGIYLEGASDDSNWTITSTSKFRNNVIAIEQAASSTGGGNNTISESHITLVAAGDIGVLNGPGNSQLRMMGNHCDGAGTGSIQYCLENEGSGTAFIGNEVENPVAVFMPQSIVGTSNNYRGLKVEGNTIQGDVTSASVITTTCTATLSSAVLTACSPAVSTLTNLQDNMIAVASANITQQAFGSGGGSGGSGNGNQMFGGVFVQSFSTGSNTITLTNNAAATGSTAVTFELPALEWPLGISAASGDNKPYLAPVVIGNTYTTWHGASALGNDGY